MKTVNTHDAGRVLLAAIRAAHAAAGAILDVYDSDFAVEAKEDRSPLTLADRRAHDIITRHLASESIPMKNHAIPVLSEEGRDIPHAERKKWDYYWLVDPLDGTREFIKRNGEFTVNIALIQANRPVLGVIYVPVKNVFYFAMQGQGAFRLDKTEMVDDTLSPEDLLGRSTRLPLSRYKSQITHHKSLVVIGSRSHATPELEAFVKDAERSHPRVEFVSAGSSLKFCLVAEGRADMYPRFGPTMEWDTAAGQIIAEEAGNEVVSRETGLPLEYNKEDLHNPWFIVKKRNNNGRTL